MKNDYVHMRLFGLLGRWKAGDDVHGEALGVVRLFVCVDIVCVNGWWDGNTNVDVGSFDAAYEIWTDRLCYG